MRKKQYPLYNHAMPNYRRIKIRGGTYFFTLVTNKRQQIFLSPEARSLFIGSMNHVRQHHPFSIEAYCILPDHIHLLWLMPNDDNNYSVRIAEIKKYFSKQYIDAIGVSSVKTDSQTKRGESGIWQRRFWEHFIRDESDLNKHIDYIHYNPVKHGLVKSVEDWPSSSFFDYVQSGFYDLDWGENFDLEDNEINFGE
jgi:putative transposase